MAATRFSRRSDEKNGDNGPSPMRAWMPALASGVLALALSPCAAAGRCTDAKAPSADGAASPRHGTGDWVFDDAPYARSPKSGARVWQYAPGKTPRHDPNAVYDSPHSPYPFAPDLYDPLWNYGPYGPYWPYYGTGPGRQNAPSPK